MEIDINGNKYSIGKLSPKQQFHVSRRLAPAIWAISEAANAKPPADNTEAMHALAPVAIVIAQMSDVDSEYVLDTCLSVVSRNQGTGWAKIQVSGGGMMFSDIDLAIMMNLVLEVIKDNLGNFFAALPI